MGNDVEALLGECTNEKLTTENWDKILEFCELADNDKPKRIVELLVGRVFHANPHVSKQAIVLLDAVMKNCSISIQNEIISGPYFRQTALKKLSAMHVVNRLDLFARIGQWDCQSKTNEHPSVLLEALMNPTFKSECLLKNEESARSISQTQLAAKEEKNVATAIAASLKDNAKFANTPVVAHDHTVMVRTLYDFEAVESNEISFKAGELITLLDDSDESWWKGSNHNGEGLFPASFVTKNAFTAPSSSTYANANEVLANQETNEPVQPVTVNTVKNVPPKPQIDETLLDLCCRRLEEADPFAENDNGQPDLACMEASCHAMTPLIDQELQSIDKEYNVLYELNQSLMNAFKMYNELMIKSSESMKFSHPPKTVLNSGVTNHWNEVEVGTNANYLYSNQAMNSADVCNQPGMWPAQSQTESCQLSMSNENREMFMVGQTVDPNMNMGSL